MLLNREIKKHIRTIFCSCCCLKTLLTVLVVNCTNNYFCTYNSGFVQSLKSLKKSIEICKFSFSDLAKIQIRRCAEPCLEPVLKGEVVGTLFYPRNASKRVAKKSLPRNERWVAEDGILNHSKAYYSGTENLSK